MALPTKPAGYWRPHVDLSTVYYLTRSNTWRVWGKDIDESEVPDDLVFLGDYMDNPNND